MLVRLINEIVTSGWVVKFEIWVILDGVVEFIWLWVVWISVDVELVEFGSWVVSVKFEKIWLVAGWFIVVKFEVDVVV